MSHIIAGRLSSSLMAPTARRAAAAFSTSAPALRPAGADAATSSASSWAWRNLSPKTRRRVGYGLAVGAVVDGCLVYEYYSGLLGLGEGTKN